MSKPLDKRFILTCALELWVRVFVWLTSYDACVSFVGSHLFITYRHDERLFTSRLVSPWPSLLFVHHIHDLDGCSVSPVRLGCGLTGRIASRGS